HEHQADERERQKNLQQGERADAVPSAASAAPAGAPSTPTRARGNHALAAVFPNERDPVAFALLGSTRGTRIVCLAWWTASRMAQGAFAFALASTRSVEPRGSHGSCFPCSSKMRVLMSALSVSRSATSTTQVGRRTVN